MECLYIIRRIVFYIAILTIGNSYLSAQDTTLSMPSTFLNFYFKPDSSILKYKIKTKTLYTCADSVFKKNKCWVKERTKYDNKARIIEVFRNVPLYNDTSQFFIKLNWKSDYVVTAQISYLPSSSSNLLMTEYDTSGKSRIQYCVWTFDNGKTFLKDFEIEIDNYFIQNKITLFDSTGKKCLTWINPFTYPSESNDTLHHPDSTMTIVTYHIYNSKDTIKYLYKHTASGKLRSVKKVSGKVDTLDTYVYYDKFSRMDSIARYQKRNSKLVYSDFNKSFFNKKGKILKNRGLDSYGHIYETTYGRHTEIRKTTDQWNSYTDIEVYKNGLLRSKVMHFEDQTYNHNVNEFYFYSKK